MRALELGLWSIYFCTRFNLIFLHQLLFSAFLFLFLRFIFSLFGWKRFLTQCIFTTQASATAAVERMNGYKILSEAPAIIGIVQMYYSLRTTSNIYNFSKICEFRRRETTESDFSASSSVVWSTPFPPIQSHPSWGTISSFSQKKIQEIYQYETYFLSASNVWASVLRLLPHLPLPVPIQLPTAVLLLLNDIKMQNSYFATSNENKRESCAIRS